MLLRVRSYSPVHRIGWSGSVGLAVGAWLVPFLVHLMPWPGARPAGVYLLPAFWTAFVAAYYCDLTVALLVALVMPAANLCVTGLPAPEWLGSMSFELVGFALAARWLVRRWPRFWLAAPLAYVAARLLSLGLSVVLPGASDGRTPLAHLMDSIANGGPGLVVLLVINLALVRLENGAADWDGD